MVVPSSEAGRNKVQILMTVLVARATMKGVKTMDDNIYYTQDAIDAYNESREGRDE